jgi:hypothetical protein
MEWIQGDGGLREATMEGFACGQRCRQEGISFKKEAVSL